ncbi:hypothetical protein CH063_05726 [Colletotrichum higginsianum]|uniref:Uncharacterized protein n=1 Tax=Colletotrichum higginsianum (strain IMI 349063) TaxID=759273 RepID=H1V012_COLHI|nr:hypothetical protein CH063_05726 [Colletotrichum higginsianum]
MRVLFLYSCLYWLLVPALAGSQTAEDIQRVIREQHGDSTALSNISAASWVASPVVRGSIDIIWTCVVTLGACVYTVLHLNVPAKNGRYAGLIDKLRWVVIAILFPEYVLVIAAYQLREAQNLRKELQKHLDNNASTSKQLVELDFCFFVIMGGYQVTIKDIQPGPEFTYNSNCEDIHRLSSEGFLRLVELGEINIETAVRTSHLKDRSKANIIQKALVLMQIGWMLLQCIARKAQGLPITLLELHTMVHVACAAAMYSFWFSKPLDIGYPEMLDSESETMRGFLALSVQSQLCKKNEIEFTIQTQELESNSTHPGNHSAGSQPRASSITLLPNDPTQEPHLTDDVMDDENAVSILEIGQSLSCGIRLRSEKSVTPSKTKLRLTAEDRTRLERSTHFVRKKGNNEIGLDYRQEGVSIYNYLSHFHDLESMGVLSSANDRPIMAKTSPIKPSLIGILLPFIYSGLHLVAWNYEFPTTAEGIMWKVACIVSCNPIGWVLIFIMARIIEFKIGDKDDYDVLLHVIIYVILEIVFAAFILLKVSGRVFLAVESFASIRRLPIGAYSMPVWLQMLPHL